MLDEADLVLCRTDGILHFPLETREAIDQRRDAANDPGAISHGSRRLAAPGGWQLDDGGAPD
jgi:hypothetical protein